MARVISTGDKDPGSSPGTMVYVGDRPDEEVRVAVIEYSPSELREFDLDTIDECSDFADTEPISWMNVEGLNDLPLLQKIGEYFGLHPLVLEDIVNTSQRPKLEVYDGYLFIVLKMITFDSLTGKVRPEHISLVVGQRFVITFIEDAGDVFDPVRERLRKSRGKIRRMGADYLAYALLDSVVDTYFSVVEAIGDQIEKLEEEVVERPVPDTVKKIHVLKRELIYLRRAVWPLRESVNVLLRDDSDIISDTTKVFLRDLYDHVIQVIDAVETLRDLVAGMLEVYLSSISNRMNEVMKVLTVISTIFIPLTFIVGVYGMNFDFMPELHSVYGYPAVMLLMVLVAISLLIFFRNKRWI